MSALGQKRTSERDEPMSALPPKADIALHRSECPLCAKSRHMQCGKNSVIQTPRRHDLDVAAQVRAQGYRCDQPVTAKEDVKLSKPDSAVWILKCNQVTFRVRLYPDMAAYVKKLK
jgi:hypothetical protein